MGEGNIYWKIDASQFFLKIFSQDYGKLLKVTLWEWHAKLACKYCFIRGKPLQWCWLAQHKQVTIGSRGPALFKPDGKVSIDRPVLSEWFPHPVQSRAPELFLGTSIFFLPTWPNNQRDCSQPEKLRTSLEKLLYYGNCNLLVMLLQIYTLGNNLRLSLLFTSKCLEWQSN